MRKLKISIAIPSNVLEDCNDLRSKTRKIGEIARSAAIFRVEEILIYSVGTITQKNHSKDIKIIKEILAYLDCPQYLRRKIFPKAPIYRYVGILPPLRTPHHPLEKKIAAIESNSIREGLVLSSNNQSSEIEIGLEKPIKISVPNLPTDKRITLRLSKKSSKVYGVPVKKIKIENYWGFDIYSYEGDIQSFIKKYSNCVVIATSKRGNLVKQEKANLLQKLREKNKILLLFGSPSMGLFEIFEKNGLYLGDWVDFILNFVFQQGTYTIRVEEAIISALAILNYMNYQ